MSDIKQAKEVLAFWEEIGPQKWWSKDDVVDQEIRDRFGSTHKAACSGELNDWLNDAHDCLGLVIVLDQFSRNLNRGSADAFAADERALRAAKYAVKSGYDKELADASDSDIGGMLFSFFYLPFMHCERLQEQEECVKLMHAIDEPNSIKAAIEHREIIARFGRFPHRNDALGRHTTPAEILYLEGGGFKG